MTDMFRVETGEFGTNLVCAIEKDERIDTLALGMVKRCDIEGMLPVSVSSIDETKYLKYCISGRVRVSDFFASAVKKAEVLRLFDDTLTAIISAEEYMLSPSMLIYDTEYMFYNASSGHTELIFLPLLSKVQEDGCFRDFFKTLLFAVHYDQSENCDYIAKLIALLSGNADVTPKTLRDSIRKLMEDGECQHSTPAPAIPAAQPQTDTQTQILPNTQTQRVTPPAYTGTVRKAQTPAVTGNRSPGLVNSAEKPMTLFRLLMHYSAENKEKYKAAKAEQGQNRPNKPGKQTKELKTGFSIPGTAERITPSNDAVNERTTVECEQNTPAVRDRFTARNNPEFFVEQPEEDMTLLVAKAVRGAELLRVQGNERIPIDKPVFRIGKDSSKVEYLIRDNATVSRVHANIITRAGDCFAIDMNSTNHTYINGVPLRQNTEVLLRDGDIIRLSNEEFVFSNAV